MPNDFFIRLGPQWAGGENNSQDPSLVPYHQLTQARNIIFSDRATKKKRDGIDFDWDGETSGSDSVVGLSDFWFGSSGSRTHRVVAVTDAKEVYSYQSDGTRSDDLFAGTSWGSAVTLASLRAYNNLLIICADGSNNVVKKWTGSGDIADLGGTPPDASFCSEFQGRLILNDIDNLDRFHYSSIENAEEWLGTGDSAAIDIRPGDGDPEGITAFLGELDGWFYVAKRTKIYRVGGSFAPELWEVRLVAGNIGCVGPNAFARTENDIIFASDKGIHSIVATEKFGDTETAYLSTDIQNWYKRKVPRNRRKYIHAAYNPDLNSVGFSVTDEDLSSTVNKVIAWYNIELIDPNTGKGPWFFWRDLDCESMATIRDTDKERVYLGTSTTRVAKTEVTALSDTNESGSDVGITYTVQTPRVAPSGNPNNEHAFYGVYLFYAPTGESPIQVTATIDNHASQSASIDPSLGGDRLDIDFVLDQSILAGEAVMAPYYVPIDGIGRTIELSFQQSGADEVVDLLGYAIEYSVLGPRAEVN